MQPSPPPPTQQWHQCTEPDTLFSPAFSSTCAVCAVGNGRALTAAAGPVERARTQPKSAILKRTCKPGWIVKACCDCTMWPCATRVELPRESAWCGWSWRRPAGRCSAGAEGDRTPNPAGCSGGEGGQRVTRSERDKRKGSAASCPGPHCASREHVLHATACCLPPSAPPSLPLRWLCTHPSAMPPGTGSPVVELDRGCLRGLTGLPTTAEHGRSLLTVRAVPAALFRLRVAPGPCAPAHDGASGKPSEASRASCRRQKPRFWLTSSGAGGDHISDLTIIRIMCIGKVTRGLFLDLTST